MTEECTDKLQTTPQFFIIFWSYKESLMLEFHHVTSSYFLLHAKWSIRQASYITTCSFKITKPARMNHLMLCSQIELNVISAGLSEWTYISLQLRRTSNYCVVTTTIFHFYCWNKYIYAIYQCIKNQFLLDQTKALSHLLRHAYLSSSQHIFVLLHCFKPWNPAEHHTSTHSGVD